MSNNPSVVIKITQATAGSSPWYKLSSPEKLIGSITGILSSGDSVVVELSNDKGLDTNLDRTTMISSGTTAQIAANDPATTTSFSSSFYGPWLYARITKTGSAGSAIVFIR